MISPPPVTEDAANGYGDYFAVKKWLELPISNKYIIFVGELGASDGSTGMYKYMLNHPKLKLVVRSMIYLGKDIFDGKCEKELFIFEKV
jgi:hypothetical protein